MTNITPLSTQIIWFFILALPVACISWTVTHEEIFADMRAYLKGISDNSSNWFIKKIYYLFTCEYCFSFYVTALLLLITKYQLLFADWRGYLISELSLIWIANIYMSLYFFIKIDIKKKGTECKIEEQDLIK
ncbi:MAG: hypothetical protein H7068_13295 [Pedobacter sp.]|nr:hypothetical protein [Chitinophagaceae bacterium]